MAKLLKSRQVMAAFITFERQQDRISCVRAYNSPWYLTTLFLLSLFAESHVQWL
jgi:hypothetical protein